MYIYIYIYIYIYMGSQRCPVRLSNTTSSNDTPRTEKFCLSKPRPDSCLAAGDPEAKIKGECVI